MKKSTVLVAPVVFVLLLVAIGGVPASDDQPGMSAAVGKTPATHPASTQPGATQPAEPMIPAEVLKKIEAQFNLAPPRPTSRAEYVNRMTPRMLDVLKLGQEAEKEYPRAANIYLVRRQMIMACNFLAVAMKDDDYVKRMLSIASQLVASDAPPREKVQADFLLTRAKIIPDDEPMIVKEAEAEIQALVKRYEKTEGAGLAVIQGVILAKQADRVKLMDQLADRLTEKHLDEPGAMGLLRSLERHPDVGRPFEAALTRLDGTKLNLPVDLKGKVVVIDFWATWCPPCVEEIPHMKQLYANFKDKGVEFVGISLDTSRKELTDLVTGREMGWIHTFTGKGWGDPTVQKYGVGGIPSIWVVGKDGNVVSDNARRNLEAVIEMAIKAPASRPAATKPAATMPASEKTGPE